MRDFNYKLGAVALVLAGLLGLASCTAEQKADEPTSSPATGDASRIVSIAPGEAGGTIEESLTASATVKAIDPSTRMITLVASDSSEVSFKAGPEIRNFDQIHVGDKVTATIVQRLIVFVRKGDEDPSVTHAAALARAPKGAKPGVLAGEAYEITATITAIDMINRTATLRFADGLTKTVTPRADVEMMRYKVGDTVVIRVTQALSVLVDKP